MLLILNLPLIGIFAPIARLRPQLLMPIVSILCLVGTYSIRFSIFDIWVMMGAGIFAFYCRWQGFPAAPLVIGMILGPMTENNFWLTMQMFEGNLFQIIYRPVAMVFLSSAVLFQILMRHRARISLLALRK